MSTSSIRYHHELVLSPAGREATLLNWIGLGKTVLELGCSTGYFSEALQQRGCSVVGLERDPEAANRARPFCKQVICTDLAEANWLDMVQGKFDVILIADVLEHLINPGAILASCASLLGPKGFVLISLPNVAYWRIRLALFFGQFEYTDTGILDHTHLKFFTLKTAQRLIESAGYRVTHRHVTIGFNFLGSMHPLFSRFGNRFCPGLLGYQQIYRAEPI